MFSLKQVVHTWQLTEETNSRQIWIKKIPWSSDYKIKSELFYKIQILKLWLRAMKRLIPEAQGLGFDFWSSLTGINPSLLSVLWMKGIWTCPGQAKQKLQKKKESQEMIVNGMKDRCSHCFWQGSVTEMPPAKEELPYLFDVFPLCRGLGHDHAYGVQDEARQAQQLHPIAHKGWGNHIVHKEGSLVRQEHTSARKDTTHWLGGRQANIGGIQCIPTTFGNPLQ